LLTSMLAMATALATFSLGAQDELPRIADGFKVDVIAQAPDFLWPSAVHCLDDGSLLVSEDYMDMPGPSDQPIDRLWRFRFLPSGTIERTLFAERLFAVFGIEECDGSVYVMNMPCLTRLKDLDDDGVADQRTEVLTTLGPPAPGWPGGFNDHIVSGMRLGVDGFLYISVGDKGVPRAVGTDGSTLTLRGGGVIRLKPDGTELEIVASGNRNHLDVAMTEEDHLFTFDNTDDGLGWWTRFSHIVPTGDYGYPWDYQSHKERFLAPLAEFGGGSPCGGLVLRENAWPEGFRGNVLFCEWADRVLRRFEVVREGAGYRLLRHEDFMIASGGREFRPVDVCESPDGRSLYVADWGHDGWQAKVKTGRVLRVRMDPEPPAPERPMIRPDSELPVLAAMLSHSSFRLRIDAQRELVRRGVASESFLCDWLARPTLDLEHERARRHAVWALESIGSERARVALQGALHHPGSGTREQVVRAIGARRWSCSSEIALLLRDADLFVRREAAIALGRIGDPAAIADLVRALEESEDAVLCFVIRKALRALVEGHAEVLARAFETASDRLRAELRLALRECFDLGLAHQWARIAKESGNADVRSDAVELLAGIHRRQRPWDGKWWQIQPAKEGHPPKVEEWEGTAPVILALLESSREGDPSVRRRLLQVIEEERVRDALCAVRERVVLDPQLELRRLALHVLLALRDEGCADTLKRLLAQDDLDGGLLADAVETMRGVATEPMVELLVATIGRMDLPSAPVVRAIEALGSMKAMSSVTVLEKARSSPDGECRAAAVVALAQILDAAAMPAIAAAASEDSGRVRAAACRAVAQLKLANPVEIASLFLPLVADSEVGGEALKALARFPTAKAIEAYLHGLISRDPQVREHCAEALVRLRTEVRPVLEEAARARRIPPQTLVEVRALFSRPLPIMRWQILGPFPPDLEAPTESWGEARTVDAEGSHGFVNLKSLFPTNDHSSAFARATLLSARADRVDVLAGSDDSLALWVNGSRVHDFPKDRGWTADEDRFEVDLIEGENVVVARVGQGVGDWAFNLKVGEARHGPLFEGQAEAARTIEDYRAFALSNSGDAGRGRTLFFNAEGPKCFKCHRVAGEGGQIGPDLSDVGAKYRREELISSVLEPSKRRSEGYRTTLFALADGRLESGIVQSENDGRIVLALATGDLVELIADDVIKRRESELSAMPEGLTAGFSLEEFADLIAFMESHKTAPSSR